jgi:hypothetical protein
VPILLGYDVYDVAYMPEVKGNQTEQVLIHRAAEKRPSRKLIGIQSKLNVQLCFGL